MYDYGNDTANSSQSSVNNVNMEWNDTDMYHVDLDVVKSRLMKIKREKWWVDVAEMPKLRTYVELYDVQDDKGIVYTHLTRRQRCLVVKVK